MESGRSWSLRFRNRVAELFMPESSTKKQVAKLRQSTCGWWWLSLFVVALRVVLSFGCCHPGADFLGGGSSANLLRCRSDGSAQHSRFLHGADASKSDATVDTGLAPLLVVSSAHTEAGTDTQDTSCFQHVLSSFLHCECIRIFHHHSW